MRQISQHIRSVMTIWTRPTSSKRSRAKTNKDDISSGQACSDNSAPSRKQKRKPFHEQSFPSRLYPKTANNHEIPSPSWKPPLKPPQPNLECIGFKPPTTFYNIASPNPNTFHQKRAPSHGAPTLNPTTHPPSQRPISNPNLDGQFPSSMKDIYNQQINRGSIDATPKSNPFSPQNLNPMGRKAMGVRCREIPNRNENDFRRTV